MCNLCKNNNINRNYTHSRSTHHLKHLKKLFKKYKEEGFPWEDSIINVIPPWVLELTTKYDMPTTRAVL